MKDNEIDYVNGARTFFLTHFWILSIILIVSVAMNTYMNFQREVRLSSIEKQLEKINAGVIIMGIDGEAYYAKKSYVDVRDPLFKKYLKKFTKEYFVDDVVSLTNDRKDVPENVDEFYEKHEDFSNLGNYYMDLKGDNQNFNDMMQHLKVLLNLINTDNLVEEINVISSRIESYSPKGDNGFEIKVSHRAKVDFYLQEEGEWKDKRGNVVITLEGKIEKNFQTPMNPMGIRIIKFDTNYLTKREI